MLRASAVLVLASVSLAALACGADPAEDGPQGETAKPSPIGRGDGGSDSVDFVEIYAPGAATELVDLDFNPQAPDELWVLGYDSSVHVGRGVLGDAPSWSRFKDPAALHFMHKPPALEIGDNGFWGTCGNNDNSQNTRVPNYFMGPALFTTDLAVFAKKTATGLGSHYDMLHGTPFCRGIAHVEANEYWVFNAHDASLDRYDFNDDHGPGNDDHSDGEIYRYAVGQVKGADDDTSSHLAFDPEDGFLYVADTGNRRIVRLDTTTGTKVDALPRTNEPLAGQGIMEGAAVEEVVPPGVLEKPSGIEVHGGVLFVTDAATSTFHVFDKAGKAAGSLATGLPPDSLSGFTFDDRGRIWFTDRTGGRVVRIDPKP